MRPEDVNEQNLREFGDEFDVIPLPDETQAQANAPKCDMTNMKYIKSHLPMAHIGLQDFFTQMSKRQWQTATPFVSRTNSPMHVAKGMLAIGARRDLSANPMMKDVSKPLYKGGHAKDWDLIPGLERVNAYAFRGDRRSPRTLQLSGGFKPPSMRSDEGYFGTIARHFSFYMKERFGLDIKEEDVIQYIKGKGPAGRVFTEYQIWRSILKGEELNIGKMVQEEFMKGFVSTTRNVKVAHRYVTKQSDDNRSDFQGAVYVLHSEGGFLLPPKSLHAHGTKDDEAEIAHPGSIPWAKVMAFRPYTTVDWTTMDARSFVRNNYLFIRKGFAKADPKAYEKVFWSLGSLAPA